VISRTDFAELVGRSELQNILAVNYFWIVFVVAEANQEFTDMNEICVEHILQHTTTHHSTASRFTIILSLT
jgi:hypothetical protein